MGYSFFRYFPWAMFSIWPKSHRRRSRERVRSPANVCMNSSTNIKTVSYRRDWLCYCPKDTVLYCNISEREGKVINNLREGGAMYPIDGFDDHILRICTRKHQIGYISGKYVPDSDEY